MSMVKRVATGILWAQAGKVLETGLAFIFSLVIIRQLGPERYGEYGLLVGLVSLGTLATSLGMREILGKRLPGLLAAGDGPGQRFLARWTLAWRLALTLAAIGVFLALLDVIARAFGIPGLAAYRWPLACLFLAQNLFALPIAIFNASLRMKPVVISNTLVWLVSLLATVALFGRWGVSVAAVLYASALAAVVSFAVGLYCARDLLAGNAGGGLPTRPLWRFGVTIWLTEFANFGLGSQSDVLFMGYFLPDKAAIGYYRAAVMPIDRIMGFLFGAWGGLTMPVLAESYARRGIEGLRQAWSTYVKLVAGLALPILILLAAFAGPVLKLLYAGEYAGSVHLLQIAVVFRIFGFAVGNGLSTVLLQTFEREGLALRLRLGAGVLNAVLDVTLIPRWGAAGALVATGVAGTLMWLVETFIAMHQCQLRYPWMFIAKIVLAALAAAGLARLSWPGDGLAQLLAAGAVFAAAFWAIWLIVKPLTRQDKALLVGVAPRLERLVRLI